MVLNLVKSGSDLATVRATVERSFGNYLGGRARRDQTRELRRLREQRDALQEQIAAGASEVEPEEWARFTKLDGRLKEERRLLKTVARQTLESRAEGARKAIGEWQTLGEPFVFVEVFVDEFEKEEMSEKASKTRRSPPAPVTVGLAPDGSWIESSVSTNASNDAPEKNALPVNERLNDLFHDDEEEEDDDANEDGESPDLDEPARSAVNERGATKTVAVVDRYDPVTVANGAFASNPFPLGEFLGVDIAGDWVRFTADRVSAVTHRESAGKGAFSEVAADARRDAEETADEKKQLASLVLSAPTETSTKWRRLGDGLWSAAGAETSVFSASRAFETFHRSPESYSARKEREREASVQPLFDGAEELESFLRDAARARADDARRNRGDEIVQRFASRGEDAPPTRGEAEEAERARGEGGETSRRVRRRGLERVHQGGGHTHRGRRDFRRAARRRGGYVRKRGARTSG
jgi:hypothetical protein